ncbi:TPA: hypothetical protein ACVU4Y_003301 [Vibrio parahaemolyticus]|uniref:hypothetical protein n=2 Tax=Vibrio harveyi group TaxID=717610 RepID=UPI001122F2DA|nr:hypothetical protein [Vibrio parahaemolyticus]EJG1590598.1 hypothetical protein [Vibrio parahaemolyticus]ELI5394137.1 hypothetical protein [Vibrio parahaemolyticus]
MAGVLVMNQSPSKLFDNGREYSNLADKVVKHNLKTLIEDSTEEQYREAMKRLGAKLGGAVAKKLAKDTPSLTIAVTAEDADYLAQGFTDYLEKTVGIKVFVTCFWNDHRKDNLSQKSIAPVIHKYLQPGYENNSTLVVIKSILSSSCVVKSNILSLYSSMTPSEVHVVAPVVYKEAEAILSNDFPSEFSSKFNFTWFAKDAVREDDGTVKPGIGGQIYYRLGLKDKPINTKFMPEVVLKRMTTTA